MIFRQKRPFQTRRKSRPAPAAQIAVANHIDNILRAFILEHHPQCAIAAAGLVNGPSVAVLLVDVRQ